MSFEFSLTSKTPQELLDLKSRINQELFRRAEEKRIEAEYLQKISGLSSEEISHLKGDSIKVVDNEVKPKKLKLKVPNKNKSNTYPGQGTKSKKALDFVFNHENGVTKDQVMRHLGESNVNNVNAMMHKYTNIFIKYNIATKLYTPIMESIEDLPPDA